MNKPIEYISHMGSDLTVVNAARESFGSTSTTLTDKDISLIQFLARGMTRDDYVMFIMSLMNVSNSVADIHTLLEKYKHTPTHFAPFGHPQITIRVKAPLAIARQLWKSHIGSTGGDAGNGAWSELSKRYNKEQPEYYLPTELRLQSENVKHGSSNTTIPTPNWLMDTVEEADSSYHTLVNDLKVAPEQARFILPACTFTSWTWTGSLLFFARVYNLRVRSDAQEEARVIISGLNAIMMSLFPVSWEALTNMQPPNVTQGLLPVGSEGDSEV